MSTKEHRFDLDPTYGEAIGAWQIDCLKSILFAIERLNVVKYYLYTDEYYYHVVWIKL